jgi:hypothetical protein
MRELTGSTLRFSGALKTAQTQKNLRHSAMRPAPLTMSSTHYLRSIGSGTVVTLGIAGSAIGFLALGLLQLSASTREVQIGSDLEAKNRNWFEGYRRCKKCRIMFYAQRMFKRVGCGLPTRTCVTQ